MNSMHIGITIACLLRHLDYGLYIRIRGGNRHCLWVHVGTYSTYTTEYMYFFLYIAEREHIISPQVA